MNLEDQYRYLVGAYYGVMEMDEYPLEVYILKQVEDYIKDFVEANPIPNFNYQKETEEIESNRPLKTKLQDALLILNKIDGPFDLILMINEKIKELQEEK